jgi:hypothetical protein
LNDKLLGNNENGEEEKNSNSNKTWIGKLREKKKRKLRDFLSS